MATKILAIKNRGLGDTALFTASLEALRQWDPHCTIDLAAPAAFQGLFREDPRVRDFVPLSSSHYQNLTQAISRKRERYHYALSFHASPTTEKMSWMSGAQRRVIHFHDRKPRASSLSMKIPHLGEPMSAVERDLNVVRSLGWQGASPRPKLWLSPQEIQQWQSRMGEWKRKGPLIAVAPQASRLAKQWPMESYLRVIEKISGDFTVLLIHDGRPSHPHQTYWLAKMQQFATFFPTPDLRTLMGVLSQVDALISGDSGVKHVACALDTPTVTLYGPESIGEWHGYDSPRHPTLQNSVGCRDKDPIPEAFAWCDQRVCPLGSHACLQLIPPDAVLEKLHAVIPSR